MAVTIKDVAEHAGVSKATVSYVLNGRQTTIKITEETQNRIYAAARELKYHPNALARGLAQKHTDTLALVLQSSGFFSAWSGFTSEMMKGAAESSFRLGYDLILHTKSQPSVDLEFSAVTDGRADGALLIRDFDDELMAKLADSGFPVVLMFARSAHPDVWYVDCDNVKGGRLAAEYLTELGHKRIAHISGPTRSSAAMDRKLGFEFALLECGLQASTEFTFEAGDSKVHIDMMRALFSQADRPTAIFAWSDDAALLFISLARKIGLRIPEDVSVVGFDSTALCEYTNPRLTSMRQPVYEMTCAAMEMLATRIRGVLPSSTAVVFQPELQVRNSCLPTSGK